MPAQSLASHQIKSAVRTALQEDMPFGDMTVEALFPSPLLTRATCVAREPMTLAGLAIAREVFNEVDPSLKIKSSYSDGDAVAENTILFTVDGDARSILKGERVALNFLQHLSGVATLTAKYCHAVKGFSTKILDTRKTLPGLRVLQKWAVRLGGGINHRFSLSDGILIKDNHLELVHRQGFGIDEACHLVREHKSHHLKICVEAETLDQVRLALNGQADIVLLDNMTPKMVSQAVKLINGRALIEVSGGITLKNVRRMAAAGANFISLGALTHSAPAMNINMDVTKPPKQIRRSRS